MSVMIFPGSFDPITVGHVDIIRRASRLTDTLIVTVLINEEKTYFFSLEERLQLIRDAVADIPNVQVDAFDGLTVDYMRRVHAVAAVRGVRNEQDLQYEMQWVSANKQLCPEFEAVFLPASEQYRTVSSTAVNEALRQGKDVSALLHPQNYAFIMNRTNHI